MTLVIVILCNIHDVFEKRLHYKENKYTAAEHDIETR